MDTDPRVAAVVAIHRAKFGEPPCDVITFHQHDGVLLVATVDGLATGYRGLATYDPTGPIVVLRAGLEPWTRREVFAHELAHLIFDQPRRDWHLRRNDEKAVREARAEAVADVLLREFQLSDIEIMNMMRHGGTLSTGLVVWGSR